MTGVEHDTTDDVGGEEDQPRGTFVLLLLFLLAIAVTFAWTYLTLLERS